MLLSLGHCLCVHFFDDFIVILQHDINNCLPCNCPRNDNFLFVYWWKGAQRPHVSPPDLKELKEFKSLVVVFRALFSISSRNCPIYSRRDFVFAYVQLVCIKNLLNIRIELFCMDDFCKVLKIELDFIVVRWSSSIMKRWPMRLFFFSTPHAILHIYSRTINFFQVI